MYAWAASIILVYNPYLCIYYWNYPSIMDWILSMSWDSFFSTWWLDQLLSRQPYTCLFREMTELCAAYCEIAGGLKICVRFLPVSVSVERHYRLLVWLLDAPYIHFCIQDTKGKEQSHCSIPISGTRRLPPAPLFHKWIDAAQSPSEDSLTVLEGALLCW